MYKNKEDLNKYQRDYYKKHKEVKLKRAMQYYYDNKDDKQFMYNRKKKRKKWGARIRLECLIYYSSNPPRCACCGESHIEFLSIDHIKGRGCKHRIKLFGSNVGGLLFYLWLKRNGYPKGYQVLCYNCNTSKGHYGYCPHKKER